MNHSAETEIANTGNLGALGWRVHLCTTTSDQAADATIVYEWLEEHGCTLLAHLDDSLEVKLDAAQHCDLCLLLLGPAFLVPHAIMDGEPTASFSDTELEVSAAADVHPDKVMVFARNDAERTSSAEQHEFAVRIGGFAQGKFYARYPTMAELREERLQAEPQAAASASIEDELAASFRMRLVNILDEALSKWNPPQPLISTPPRAVSPDAIMISSTGDLRDERAAVRSVLNGQNPPVPHIDYLHEPSESVTPVDRVVNWARHCRALILILDWRYGYVSPLDGLGATELEFVTALEARRPILAFLGPHADNTEDKDQQQFIERVRSFVLEDQIVSYSDTLDLEKQLRSRLGHIDEMLPPVTLPAAGPSVRLRWYRRQVVRWLGRVPHPLRAEGMPLEQIYVSLGVSPAPMIGGSQEDGRAEDDRKGKEETSLDAEKALAHSPRLVLRGDPGVGKSVALRWYAINAADDVLPIYIRLSAYAQACERGSVTSLDEYIRQEERRLALGSSDSESLWLEYLRTGRGMMLLDGLDEVPIHTPGSAESPCDRVVRDILHLAAQLPAATPIVVATRVLDGGAERLAPTFAIRHVQPLNSTQQRQLVLQWLHTAHPDDPLNSVQTVQRVLDILQAQAHLQSWATTPLMLTLLTALIDSAGNTFTGESLSKAVLLRRAMRLLLAQWGTLAIHEEGQLVGKRNLGGRHLLVKELLLIQLAWSTFSSGRRQIVTEANVRLAWQKLPPFAQSMGNLSTVLVEMSSEDGFLPQVGEGEYSFYHPVFQEYLSASMMTALPHEELVAWVTRKRLDASWDETTQLLAAELDRLGRAHDTDAIIQTLIETDQRPLLSLTWADPLHLALRRAARVQGSRTEDHAQTDVAVRLATIWSELLQHSMKRDKRNERTPGLRDTIYQALLDMGPAAAPAALPLRQIVSKAATLYSRQSPATIEALANCRMPEDVALLANLLETGQGIDNAQTAALRGLLLFGPKAVRPYRDLLPRFVYAQRSMGADMTASSGEPAAILLIHLEPTREELEAIGGLGGRWKQEALWATSLLPMSDALDMLEQGLNAQSVFRSIFDERSNLDFSDDTEVDNRFAALAASSRLGLDSQPLLPLVLFRTIFDIPRNRTFAESIVISLGSAAVPAMRAFIEEHCANEVAREHYFGHVIAGLDIANDAEDIRSLLAEGIKVLREIKRIQDEQPRPWMDEERAAHAARIERETITPVSLDRLLESLHTAQTRSDPLIRDVVITQSLDAIAHIGPSAAAALGEICLLASDRRYRRHAMQALAGLGVAAAPAFTIIKQALGDDDAQVRAHAVEAIGRIGEAGIPALPTLRAMLSDRSNAKSGQSEVRRQVIFTFGRLWPSSRSLLSEVLTILRTDTDTEMRVVAADTLGQVADANPLVLDALHTVTLTWQSSTIWGANLQEHARDALEKVLSRMEDANNLPSVSPSLTGGAASGGQQQGLLGRLARLMRRSESI